MNLKESFRYQSFLDDMMDSARSSLLNASHMFKITKTHQMKKANANAEDIVEEVEVEDFPANDDVVLFMESLIKEKRLLGEAISKSKESLDIDIDAQIASNKYRREMIETLRYMVNTNKRNKYIEKGTGYVFNNDGNQSPYYYDVVVDTVDNFNREDLRGKLKSLSQEADDISNQIEKALVNAEVQFSPMFDVNGTFRENMDSYTTE